MRKLKLLFMLCLVAIAASASKAVYLVPGSWNIDGARYALYMFNSDSDNAWVDFTDADSDGTFEAVFDEAYSKMILCRMDGATTENNWTNKWNQSANLDAPTVDGLRFVNKSSSCGDNPWLSIINPTPNVGDDMTGAIANSNITGNADCWTITGQARYYNGTGFDGTASFIELTNWGSSWDATISQTVSNLPNGYYKVRAAGQMSGAADCWMKLVANGKENYFSRNGDSNGNIKADGTETAIGSGVAGWRYSTVLAKVTDGTLEISAVGHSNVKERWANVDAFTLTYLGSEIAPNTDVTDFINNWDFWGCFNNAFNGWTIDANDGGNSWVNGNSFVEHWVGTAANANFDYYQTLLDIPEGRYAISASMWNTQEAAPNGNAGVYGTSNGVTAFAGVTIDSDNANLNTYSTEVFVNNGELRLGVKNNGTLTARWFGVDWIKLNYMGKVVQDYAEELPADGAMAADTWYYFDIAAAADNYKATATTLGSIICTDNGNTLVSATSGDVTLAATNNSFAAKRYYVKSSSANNLVVEASSYVYSVSEATADKVYVQPGQTVTISYAVSTNDPAATLAQDYANVTLNGVAVACTAAASGFTFVVPDDVEAGKELTLAIPAEAIGYAAGSTYNVAQDITLSTPVIFDGTYFFKVANETDAKGKYLSRGRNYGTHATLDIYGLPIIVATDANNVTTLSPADTKRYYFHTSSYDCYADGGSVSDNSKFTISLVDGKYRIHNNAMADGLYLKYTDSEVSNENISVYDDGNGTNDGPIIEWTLETPTEHATAMQALKDNQAATAAAAAFASGDYASLNGISTVAALEAELTANYIKGDFVAPSEISSVSEKYQGDQPNNGNTTETVYSNTIEITKAGFYKFSMQAFYRAASNANTQAMHTAGVDFPPVALFFGDAQTQIKSLYDEEGSATVMVEGNYAQYNGQYYANNTTSALQMFKADKFHNDVWLYVSTPGTYTYGVKYMGFANANMQWFIYSPESVTITSYAAAADATDYANLNSAIAANEGKALGFEKDEYAPYNNIAAFKALADAKAIDQTATNSKLLVESAIAAMDTWVANTEEVNAFYDGDFSEPAIQETSANGTKLPGWTSGNNIRQILGTVEKFPGLVDASAQKAIFAWSGGAIYGQEDGYTIPLKANTTYLLSFKAAGWNGETRGNITVSVLNGEDGLASTSLGAADSDISEGMTTFMYEFTTGAAGNYVFTIKSANNMVLTDFALMKAPDFTIAGDESLFGTDWDVNDANNELTLNTDGTYSKTYTGIALTGNVEYKVVKNHDYANGQWPASNRVIGINMPGTYDVTIHFNPATDEVYETMALYKNITAAKYATLYAPYDLNFEGSGVTAYIAKLDGTTVSFEEVTSVPANTGLLLKADAEDTYKFKMEASTQNVDENKLEGVTEDTKMGAGIYVLLNTDNKPGFYKTKGEFTVGAYTAYLPAIAGAREFIGFGDDTTTGIDAISTKTMDGEVYNLNGQRVNKAHKGLYIVNGKKVVLK